MRYLTGVDWLVHGFDDMTRGRSDGGNDFHIVLQMEGRLDPAALQSHLNEFIEHYPLFKGKASRAWNLAPYWHIPKGKAFPRMIVHHQDITRQEELHSCLQEIAKRGVRNREMYLSCELLICESQTYAVFTFSHRLFDGLGAEFFLGAFGEFYRKKEDFSFINPIEPSHLDQWGKKLSSGRTVHRRLLQMSPQGRVRGTSCKGTKFTYEFRTICFTPEETSRVMERANQEAGYLLIMPFLLAQTAGVFHELFNRKEIPQDPMLIPVTVSARKADDDTPSMFFNHLSLLFFKLESETCKDSRGIVSSIKKQLFDQMKEEFPQKFSDQAMLMRILPLSVLSRIMGVYSKGKIASLAFSYMGETALKREEWMGKTISNLYHLPRPSIPPGIGVFFGKFRNRLNVTFSYIKEILTEEDIAFVLSEYEKLPGD